MAEKHTAQRSAPVIKEHTEIINISFPEGKKNSHGVASGFNAWNKTNHLALKMYFFKPEKTHVSKQGGFS